IDLGNDGVTLNDSKGHSGPNLFQDFPMLTTINSKGGTTTISGTLDSSANQTFHIELYSNPSKDASGYGEGQTFLGFFSVTTNASGHASFMVSNNLALPGQWITATATDSTSNTSEFSQAVVVQSS